MRRGLLTAILGIVLFSCNNSEKKKQVEHIKEATEEKTPADKLVASIEKKHKKEELKEKGAIKFDLALTFGGKKRFKGTITMTSDGSKIRMQDSLKTAIWDGKDVYLSPDTAASKGVRFAINTWSYFFAAAYKLSDEGASHEYLSNQPLNGKDYEANRLTFVENVGDSPDDWYIVYKDNETDLLAGLAYIVTFGDKSKEKAEADPHAITYEAYVDIEGVPFATQWNFWTWNDKGELNKLLGSAVLSKIEIIKKADAVFQPSANSILVEKPNV